MSIDGPNFRLLECWIDQNAAGASHLLADIDYSKLDKWPKEPAWRSYPVAGLRLVVGLQNPSHPHSPFGGAQLWGLTEDSQQSSLLESLVRSPGCPMTRLKSEASAPGEYL
jgi:hypothetical protein